MNRFSNTGQNVPSAAAAVAEAPIQLTEEERQPCEVWTRVMGYHRPVASFNIGKQGEHGERLFFAQRH